MDPLTSDPVLRDALQLHRGGRIDEAERLYRSVLSEAPGNADAMHLLAIIHLQKEQLPQARLLVESAIKQNSERAIYFNTLGDILRRLGRPGDALQACERAIALNPAYAEPYNTKGLALMSQGNLLAALTAFSDAISLDPDYIQAMINRGACCSQLMRRRLGKELLPAAADGVREHDGGVRGPYTSYPWFTYLYCPLRRFVYAPVPKVACSSFKMLLHMVMHATMPWMPEFGVDKIAGRNFHIFVDQTFSFRRYSQAEASAIMASKAVFKFTIVRNPFDRIASAFLNKFVAMRLDTQQWGQTVPVLQSVVGAGSLPTNASISFRQFVGYLVRSPDKVLDQHWLPMANIVAPSEMDFVGRLERLREDFSFLKTRLSLGVDLPHMNASAKSAARGSRGQFADLPSKDLASLAAMPSTRDLYDESLEDEVRKRYARDFQVFGYDTSLVER